MFIFSLTFRAQLLIFVILMGLYSYNSFAGVDSLCINYKYETFRLSKNQLALIIERVKSVDISASKDLTPLQSKQAEATLRKLFSELVGNPNGPTRGELLENKALRPQKYHDRQTCKNSFSRKSLSKKLNLREDKFKNASPFKSHFLTYYFKKIDELNLRGEKSSQLTYIKPQTLDEYLTHRFFKELKRVVFKDIYQVAKDGINHFLDRDEERGENPLVLPWKSFQNSFNKALTKSSKDNISTFLKPYLDEINESKLRPSIFNEHKSFQTLKFLIGKFHVNEFFTLIFHESMNPTPYYLDEKLLALKERVKRDFQDFERTYLSQELLLRKLEKELTDYLPRSFKNIESILLLIFGLCEQKQAQEHPLCYYVIKKIDYELQLEVLRNHPL